MPCVTWHPSARVRVLVGGDGSGPQRVIRAIGGVEKGVLVGPGGGARGSASFCLPVLSPEGESAFPSNGLRVGRGLDPIKGSTGGEVASHERFEACCVVRDPEPCRL